MTSTINPNIPAVDADLLSPPIQQNFQAAYNDVNGIQAILAALGNMSTQNQNNVTITGGAIAGTTLNAGTVPYSALASIGTARVLGNISGISGAPTALTSTQLTTLVNTFTSGAAGLVPASGGGTSNFLRADGTFASPGTGSVTSVALTADSFFLTASGSPITSSGTITLSDATHPALTLIGNPSGSIAAPTDIEIGPTLLFTGANLGTIAITGDITTSANSFTTAIGNNKVTNAKMATSTANSLAGYNNSGAFSDVTIGTGLSLASGILSSTTTGTVTSVSVTTANGVSGSVATATTTPAITLTLGAITPSSIVATGNISGLNLSGTNTGDQLTFKTIAVSGQSDIVADAIDDTLTIVAGTNITLTTDASGDTLTIDASSSGFPGGGSGALQYNTGSGFGGFANFDGSVIDLSGFAVLADTYNGNAISSGSTSGDNTGDQNLFSTIAVSGQSNINADSTADTLTFVAGTNITITTDASTDSITINASSASGYATIQEEGSSLTQRATMNFIGGGITAADDAGNTRTNITLASQLNTFAAYNTNGLFTQTAAGAYTGRTITGTSNRLAVSNGDGVSGNPTLNIDTAYVGQTSITTVGTITTGTWSGLFGAVTGANLTNLTAANISAGTAGIDISGNAATVTVADAAADTTTWVLLGTSQTGSLAPASDAGLIYNANTNALTTTTFVGALTGNASTATSATTATTATNVTVANEATDTTCFPLFVTAAAGDLPPKSTATLTWNSNTGALGATSFVGAGTSLTGIPYTITGTANQVVASAGTGNITLSLPQSIATASTPQFARLGLGQAADASAVMAATGQYFSTEFDNGNITTTATINWNNGNVQYATMTGNVTLTFTNPKSGARLLLQLAGAFTPTFPATVRWSGAVTPTPTAAAGKKDIYTFIYSGKESLYDGAANLNFATT